MSKYAFGDIAINSTEKKKPESADKAIYIGLEHLDSGCLTVRRFGADVAPIGDKLVMKKGDVLFGKRRAYQKKVAIAPFDGIFSAHGMVLRPKTAVIDKGFFPLFIASDYFLDAAIKISVGSLSPTINWSDLKRLEFSLPPLDEQKKLAQVLWSAIELKEAYQVMLARCDEMASSRFIEMFATSKRQISLKDACDVFCDGDWIESKDQSDSGIRLIQTGNIKQGIFFDKGERARYIDDDTFSRLHCTPVLAHDILISRLPDPVGRACIIPDGIENAITAVDCTIVRLKPEFLPEYFIGFTLTCLYQAQIDTFITGSTRQRISRKNLSQIKIPSAEIQEQKRFAQLFKQLDKSKVELQKSIASTSAMIKSLLSEAMGE